MRKKNSTRLRNTSKYISKEDLSEKCTDVINVFDSEQPVGDDEELQERLFELHEVGRTRYKLDLLIFYVLCNNI